MRRLLTSTFLVGFLGSLAPVAGQVYDAGSDLSETATGGSNGSVWQDETSNAGSLFSVGSAPLLRGSTGEPVTGTGQGASMPDTNQGSSYGSSLGTVQGSETGGTLYPVEPVAPVEPVSPLQGGGGRAESLDPYEPTGMRVGSFLLYPALTLYADVTDNIDFEQDGRTGKSGRAELELRAQSDWARHQASLFGTATLTGYNEPNRKPDTEFNLEGNLRLDLADLTQLELNATGVRQRVSANDVEALASGASGSVETDLGASFALYHDAGLVGLQLRGSIDTEKSEQAAVQNTKTYMIGGRASYRYTDQISPFVDLEVSRLRCETCAETRDGDNLRAAVGVELVDRETLTGEASIGIMTWKPKLASVGDEQIFFADASLTWSPNPLWHLTGGLETTMTSSSTQASTVETRTIKLAADYDVLRNLTLGARGDFTWEKFNGLGREDLVVDASLSAQYSVNRTMQVIARLGHERRDSNQSGVDYTANSIAVGLRFQR